LNLVRDEIAGDPMNDRRWIRRSLRKLQRALASKGDSLSPMTLRRLLLSQGIRPRANVKHLTPRPHLDRDRQFRYVRRQHRHFERLRWPVISVDGKKKELIGPFKNPGRAWNARSPEVYTHDFPNDAIVKAVPYGVYDLRAHHGAVFIGLSGDTPDFAVECIVRWWRQFGRHRYPRASHLLILADGGGSNGYRPRRWKTQLQARVANAFGLQVTVCHYPPGASKWNPIEHRLFSQISQTWAGLPLTSIDLMLTVIRSTTTASGMRVTATLIHGHFPRNLAASAEEWAQLSIRHHRTCPLWNYTLSPRKNGK
jgi:hypothetical protein